jgi:hypothetical protein
VVGRGPVLGRAGDRPDRRHRRRQRHPTGGDEEGDAGRRPDPAAGKRVEQLHEVPGLPHREHGEGHRHKVGDLAVRQEELDGHPDDVTVAQLAVQRRVPGDRVELDAVAEAREVRPVGREAGRDPARPVDHPVAVGQALVRAAVEHLDHRVHQRRPVLGRPAIGGPLGGRRLEIARRRKRSIGSGHAISLPLAIRHWYISRPHATNEVLSRAGGGCV